MKNTIASKIGTHQLNLSSKELSETFKHEKEVFVFDYMSMNEFVKSKISYFTIDMLEINLSELDAHFVSGQSEIDILNLNDSFWSWGENKLVPFGFISDKVKRGPFHSHEGILFFSSIPNTSIENIPIVLLETQNKKSLSLHKVADTFSELKLRSSSPNRALSEQLKQEGNAFFGQGNFDSAIASYFEAIKADSSNPNPYNNIGMVYASAEGNHGLRSETFFQLSYLVEPTYVNGMRGYSAELGNRGDLDAAIDVMENAVKAEPSALNYAILSRFYLNNGNTTKAKANFVMGKKVDENHPEIESISEHF